MIEPDFWGILSAEDQQAINEGIAQLDRGESISFEEAEKEIQEYFNFQKSNSHRKAGI